MRAHSQVLLLRESIRIFSKGVSESSGFGMSLYMLKCTVCVPSLIQKCLQQFLLVHQNKTKHDLIISCIKCSQHVFLTLSTGENKSCRWGHVQSRGSRLTVSAAAFSQQLNRWLITLCVRVAVAFVASLWEAIRLMMKWRNECNDVTVEAFLKKGLC